MERGPNTTTSALEATPTSTTPDDMVYVSAMSIKDMAQRLAHSESQLTQLLQQIRPWVFWAILESEAHMQAFMVVTIQHRLTPVDNCIDAFERQGQQSLSTT